MALNNEVAMVILFSILRQVNWRYYDSTPIVLLNKLMAKASPSSFWMSKGSCRAAKKVSHFRAKSSIGSSEVTLSKLFYSMTLLKIRVPGFTHFLLTLGIPQLPKVLKMQKILIWQCDLCGIINYLVHPSLARFPPFREERPSMTTSWRWALLMRNHFLWVSIRNLVVNMRSRLLPYMLVKIHRKSSRNYAQQDKTPVHHV